MAIATASGLTVHMGSERLFREVGFKLEAGDRMTLSGKNGAGKSTLLRVLAGELTPTSGSVSLQKGTGVALHDQRPPRGSDQSLGEYVASGRAEMIAAERELERLEGAMAAGNPDEGTLAAYAAAQDRLEAGGGYRWRDDVLTVLRGLGFGEAHTGRPLSSFSGGELTRASLARVLAARPGLLLLDEPTNHLDIASLEWLESRLLQTDAAIVLVAHDRWFLETVGTSVLELEAGRARFFDGPWHAWRKEQAARQIALGKAIERHEAEIARMERFVERFRAKATKARQAQSRVKMIERKKAEMPHEDPRDTRRLRFSFKEPERAARFVIKAEGLRLEVPGRTLLRDASVRVERDEHIALVGPNGAGKTTLIEVLAGERLPSSGKVSHGHNVRVGYLSQHATTASGAGTVLDAVQRETGLTGQKARALLGAFLFSGEEATKRLSDISGGEQRRLSLAILVNSGANVLILDEPTNHLDIESREALEDALGAFRGAVILVSHDRALLEAVGSRTLVLQGGRLENHLVDWATYRREADEREEREAAAQAAALRAGGAHGRKPRARPKPKGPSKNARRRMEELERAIEEAETALGELEQELSGPEAWASPTGAERSSRRHAEAKRRVEELYEELEGVERASAPAT